MDTRVLLVSAAFVASLYNSVCLGHVPTVSDGTAVDAEHAIVIDDVGLSQVVYDEITAASPQLWLTFEVIAGQELYVQLGVPVIDRLKSFRPAFAVLGPGLPAVTLPISVPAGLGGLVFTTDSVSEPQFFHEPFSGTDSWILGSQTLTLPEAGKYYVVAYVPSGQLGKLWVTLGRREQFGLGDILNLSEQLPQVRAFHEVSNAASLPCFLLPLGIAAPLLGVRWLMKRR